MPKSTTSIPDRDWTTAPYVIIGDTWAYKSDLGGAARWIVSGLFGADHKELKQYAEGRGLPILPARLVTEDEWAGQEKLRDNLSDQVVRTFQDGQTARSEVERLRATVQRVRELAQADLKCPCCSGYEDILSTLAGDGE